MNVNERFFILVEDTFLLGGDYGVLVEGNVHGTIYLNDDMYIVHMNKEIIAVEVTGIEVGHCAVESASDQHVKLRFAGVHSTAQIPQYTVLTNIYPQADVKYQVENLGVMGMSYEYERFYKEPIFQDLLFYHIVHGKYLHPMEPVHDLEKKLSLFTDKQALQKYIEIYDEKKVSNVEVSTFQDSVTLAQKDELELIINPFGPGNPINIPQQLLQTVISSKAYQQEFLVQDETEQKKEEYDEKNLHIFIATNTAKIRNEKEPDFIHYCYINGNQCEIKQHKIIGQVQEGNNSIEIKYAYSKEHLYTKEYEEIHCFSKNVNIAGDTWFWYHEPMMSCRPGKMIKVPKWLYQVVKILDNGAGYVVLALCVMAVVCLYYSI